MMYEQLIAELEARYRIMQEKAPDLAAADNLHKRSYTAIRELMAENERLKGKIVTPSGGTTFIECEDCKTFTRASRHLDSDCNTIRDLRAKIAAYESCHETSPDLLRDNLRMANEMSDLQDKLAKCEEDRDRFKEACRVVHGAVLCGETDCKKLHALLMKTNSHYAALKEGKHE